MSDTPPPHPDGEYAIVELFGHTTLVGRIAEVERFGTKMLVIEPIFAGEFLGPVFHGGAAIYRLTPCSAEIAFRQAPKENQQWSLPSSIRVTVPTPLLEKAEAIEARANDYDDDLSDFDDAADDDKNEAMNTDPGMGT